MALHFRSADTPLRDLQVWHAESSEYSFVISHESRGAELHGKPRFIASWRPMHSNRPAIALEGSPFATLEDALQACELMLDQPR
jgi:hypothetical protein